MKAEIKNGNLVLTVPFDKQGRPSSSGKTVLHASERIKQELGGIDGTTVQVNVFSPAPAK